MVMHTTVTETFVLSVFVRRFLYDSEWHAVVVVMLQTVHFLTSLLDVIALIFITSSITEKQQFSSATKFYQV